MQRHQDHIKGFFFEFFEIPSNLFDEGGEHSGPESFGATQEFDKSTYDYDNEHRHPFLEKEETTERELRSESSAKKYINYQKEDTYRFCFYFTIWLEELKKEDGKDIYAFTIKPILAPDLEYSIDKRFSDFIRLVDTLKKQVVVRAPSLPNKMIIKDETQLDKRGKELVEWLFIVSNERMFHCESFFEFIGLPKDLRKRLLEFNPLKTIYSEYDFDIGVSGFENAQSQDERFVAFQIRIEIYSKRLQGVVNSYQIKRRYKEFDLLNTHLKRKFKEYKQPLPELPTKLGFLGRDSTSSRQFKLENYVKLLITYPDIFDSVEFRKFLSLHPEKFCEMNQTHNHEWKISPSSGDRD